MKKAALVIIILFHIFCEAHTQKGIILNEDPYISKAMDQYVRINKSITHVSGWRITVISTTDRRAMEQTRIAFQQQFSMRSKWEYREPYYYLKAGAFISRADATSAFELIKKKFSTAFLSFDNKISYEEF